MQMIKIHIPDQKNRAAALLELIRRGRVMCLPDDVYVVPEPALEVVRSLGIGFRELGRGGIDYAEKALRDSLAISSVVRRSLSVAGDHRTVIATDN